VLEYPRTACALVNHKKSGMLIAKPMKCGKRNSEFYVPRACLARADWCRARAKSKQGDVPSPRSSCEESSVKGEQVAQEYTVMDEKKKKKKKTTTTTTTTTTK
jgi:hypothetical protein